MEYSVCCTLYSCTLYIVPYILYCMFYVVCSIVQCTDVPCHRIYSNRMYFSRKYFNFLSSSRLFLLTFLYPFYYDSKTIYYSEWNLANAFIPIFLKSFNIIVNFRRNKHGEIISPLFQNETRILHCFYICFIYVLYYILSIKGNYLYILYIFLNNKS